MARALTAIPPSPSRCSVLLPAFSTRKSCSDTTLSVNLQGAEPETRRRYSQKPR